MGSTQDYVDFVQECIGLGGRITSRRMFGEFGLYLDGKVVAFICDNSVFLKPLPANAALAATLPQGAPYPGAKLYWVLDEVLDDTERLQEILLVTAEAAPAPKPKKVAKEAAKKVAKKAARKVAGKATTAAAKRRKT